MAESGTSGGALLRTLRASRHRTQQWTELEADLGSGYLQRLESGRVAQPSRLTVERILAALEARFIESRTILEAFGYRASASLPTETERAWARAEVQGALDAARFPAYALDCTARLVAWNAYLPRLIDLGPQDPLPRQMTERSLLFAWFDARTPLGATVREQAAFDLAMTHAFRAELQRFSQEAWPAQMVHDLKALPRFREAWTRVAAEPPPLNASRASVPMSLQVAAVGQLAFRLAAEPFALDPRFRTVHLFPADSATIEWCEST